MLYDTNMLIKAVNDGNISLVRKIFNFNSEIILNCKHPILHYAVELGHIKIIIFLINKGININFQYNNGMVNYCYGNGETALHCAIKVGNIKIIEYLVKKGCNVNLQDISGNTPLHLIIWSQNKGIKLKIIAFLLKNGALVDIQDRWGNTAFHLAVWQADIKIVTMLLNKGVNFTIQDKWGNTPLHIASKLGNQRIISLLFLKKNNSVFYIKDKWGNTINSDLSTKKRIVQSLFKVNNTKNDNMKKATNVKEEKSDCGCCLFFF